MIVSTMIGKNESQKRDENFDMIPVPSQTMKIGAIALRNGLERHQHRVERHFIGAIYDQRSERRPMTAASRSPARIQ